MKCCTLVGTSDMITYTNFSDDLLMGLEVADGQISPFRIDYDSLLLQQLVTSVTMCDVVWWAGFLVDYISHPVINSFTTAAAITIAASQLKASSTHPRSCQLVNTPYNSPRPRPGLGLFVGLSNCQNVRLLSVFIIQSCYGYVTSPATSFSTNVLL